MRAAAPLEDLRREIDRIDQSILDLLVARGEIVARVAEVKGDLADGRPAIRPGREAEILRRLATKAGDRFPKGALVRMWRELIAAHTRVQAPMSVAVHVPPGAHAHWDLARDHFGSYTPMTRVDTSSQALRALGDGRVAVAVLPLPDEDDPWWRALLSGGEQPMRVIARLPFGDPGHGTGDEVAAFVVARVEAEASGDDITLLAIEADADVSRARLRQLMSGAGLEPRWLGACRDTTQAHTPALHLVEVDGYLDDGDPRLARLLTAARSEIQRLLRVGAYARPLVVHGPG
jgi:chorismate mutase / prephenate dehydratase